MIEKIRDGDLSVPDAKRLADIPKEKRKELLQAVNGKSHNGEIFSAVEDIQDGKTTEASPSYRQRQEGQD